MASKALGKFQNKMMKDVDQMLSTHAVLQGGTKGNKGLGHLTRAGILFLCVAWELYVEEVTIEAMNFITRSANSPDDLPLTVRKYLANYVRKSKNTLRPLDLAGDGWEKVYLDAGREWVAGHNTPKHHNIDAGMHSLIGLEKLSSNWTYGAKVVDEFVRQRGEVAHKGYDAGNIHAWQLREYKLKIFQCVIETDNVILDHLRSIFPNANRPWNKMLNPL